MKGAKRVSLSYELAQENLKQIFNLVRQEVPYLLVAVARAKVGDELPLFVFFLSQKSGHDIISSSTQLANRL
ncbi:hypothetical protein [Sporomusa ovata]|uniref:hypothetical protein n=1 Tax=Sporomusa ovata TaxID=2378 RepID=UPI00048B073F|nr:hypothetical protein [Sporomusa ovata]